MENYSGTRSIASPLQRELEDLFAAIPDESLIASLKTYYAGRRGYGYKVMWRTYVAMSYVGIPSFAALVRALQDSVALREACGIHSLDDVPSPFAYSRFITKLSWPKFVPMVKDIMRGLVRRCYDTFEDFGKEIAIDATDLKGWANGRHPQTDPDAGWVVKGDTHGQRKYVYGFKMHLAADMIWELPVAAPSITAGNIHDTQRASNVLRDARKTNSKFHPRVVVADAGYSDKKLRRLIKRQYRAEPVIKANPAHKKAMRVPETALFKAAYARRGSIERLFGRLKSHRRLNSITVRRIRKVTVHSIVPLIVMQALALAHPDSPRRCVRAV